MQLYQPTITGSLSVSGSVITNGTITATTLVVQTVTSSVSYLTGSTQFGTLSSNTHTFTGSLLVTGSVGIGVTPYNNTLGPAFDMKNGAGLFGYGDSAYLSGNMYFDGSWKVKNAGTGSQITLAGEIVFNTSNPTGSAGVTVTNTERMRITNAGNVGIGTSSVTDFGSSYTVLDVYNGTVGGYLLARSPNVTGQISVDNNTAMYVQTRTNHPIAFVTNNAERMRIGSDGRVFIGVAGSSNGHKLEINAGSSSAIRVDVTSGYSAISMSPGAIFGIDKPGVGGGTFQINSTGQVLMNTDASVLTSGWLCIAVASNNYNAIVLKDTGTTYSSGNYYQLFTNSSNTIAGGITHTAATTVNYGTSSDYRLKEDFKDFNGLEILSNIKFYDFKWKNEDIRMHGVIAHELEEQIPLAVNGIKDAVDKEGNIVAQGVDYSKIVPVIGKALQEAMTKIEELKAEIETLKNK